MIFEQRPATSEYASFYSGYVSQVPEGSVLEVLSDQQAGVRDLVRGIPEDKRDYRYAEGKWSIGDVLGHVIDTERVFGYRVLHFARGASGAIPGMDQDDFAANAPYGQRSLSSLAAEWEMLRGANLEQYGVFDEAVLNRTGTASGVLFSVRALLFIMAGHAAHHVRVLQERYL
ncbi:MAG: DinB family protein [Rhodothermales bacterium]|nr:DinB family protein [Rhodothermales bacterium]